MHAKSRAFQPWSACQEIVCSRYKTLELLRPTEKEVLKSTTEPLSY